RQPKYPYPKVVALTRTPKPSVLAAALIAVSPYAGNERFARLLLPHGIARYPLVSSPSLAGHSNLRLPCYTEAGRKELPCLNPPNTPPPPSRAAAPARKPTPWARSKSPPTATMARRRLVL